jgi:hypothetical protein
MSALKDALDAIREAAKLVDEVKRVSAQISSLAVEIRDIDRRLARIEGKWEAAIDIGRMNAARATPPIRLDKPPNKDEGQDT